MVLVQSLNNIVRQHDLSIPPAQWGDRELREAEEECELFGDPMQTGGEQ